MSSDADLIAGLIAKDRAALDALMDRYDRLVRFTVWRLAKAVCLQDPHFVDSVSLAAWMGLVGAFRDDPKLNLRSVSAFLVQVTHHECIDHLRTLKRLNRVSGVSINELSPIGVEESAEKFASLADTMEHVRRHVSKLPDIYRTMFSEVELIVDRRWTEAAKKLGWSESTLRSRWGQMLELLRKEMGEK